MVSISYSGLNKNIFLKIKRERKFYIILDRFISLLITISLIFCFLIILRKFLVDHIIENNNYEKIAPNVITNPVLQINDGLESKIEAIAEKAFFTNKYNVVVENVIIKGNNDFILRANEGIINIRSGEILLIERPIVSIFND